MNTQIPAIDDPAVHLESDEESTASLDPDVPYFLEENGREYPLSEREAKYLFPVDEHAQTVENEQHDIYLSLFENMLYLAPVSAPQNVLDLGTGTGTWAINFADNNPGSSVIGVDLSPIQGVWVPTNLAFQLLDIETEWDFHVKFDYVHSRGLQCSIYDPENLVKQAFENINPGGWLEIQETTSLNIRKPLTFGDRVEGPAAQLMGWRTSFDKAIRRTKRDPDLAIRYKAIMTDVGFTNVEVVRKELPLVHSEHNQEDLGQRGLENFLRGLEGLSSRPFIEILRWSRREVEVLLALVRRDLKVARVEAYIPVYTIFGQKPQG